MDTTTYLPNAACVDVGSQAQEDLRFALRLVEEHTGGLAPEHTGLDADEWATCKRTIATLTELTATSF